MSSNLGYTPGSGANIATDQDSGDGAHVQLVKLAYSAAGSRTIVQTDVNGLGVQVLAVASGVTFKVVNNGSAALVVDGSGVTQPISAASAIPVSAAKTAPAAVRVSDGTNWVDTIPVSIAATVTVAGTVAISGTVAATQSGTWNVGTVATITNPVTVTGTVALSGTSAVSGTVTANQGTAALIASAWNVKVGDGSNPVGVTHVGSVYALKVDVVQQVGGGFSMQDETAFTEGTTFVEVIGGVYNDAFSASPSAGQASVVRITAKRAFHINLRDSTGAESGVTGNPLFVRAVATNFPMNLVDVGGAAVTTAASGTQLVGISDAAGTAFSGANPLVTIHKGQGETRVTKVAALTASQTATALWTPAGGKAVYVRRATITVTGTGELQIFDNTNSAGNMLYQGTPPVGAVIDMAFPEPWPSAAVNNVLRWTTGSGMTGDLVVHGYEA